MLKLSNIVKNYDSGANTVKALRGVSIQFRASEFVAILGPSGCGKTTLLNIIGGLDRYTDGDMSICGKSTAKFKSKDWDTYRNHSVGFVFQSYNLIPHQSVLANVELALTLSGVSRAERRKRAAEALNKVGLHDQLHKKPNQLSGGQMQRVAIARALVNNPEILLADEPTGALDSETSVQVMELLKEIAKDRLVVMVTHNPELAEQYATRTVRLLDGQIVSDSDPYASDIAQAPAQTNKKHASMSIFTAFTLSLSNLMTKKGRTIMTAFAGSIGIVGIALILSISTGINQYIEDVEKDTLSNYPITLQSSAIDMTSMIAAMQENREEIEQKPDTIYSANVMTGTMDMLFSSASNNNLTEFKHYIESGNSGLEALTTEIRYVYSTPLNVYKSDTTNGVHQVNPSTVLSSMGFEDQAMMSADVWSQLSDNQAVLDTQYRVLSGRMPTAWNEVVLIVDEENRITDYTLYALGFLDIADLQKALQQKLNGEDAQIDTTIHAYSYNDFIGHSFKILPSSDYFAQENGIWVDKSKDTLYLAEKLKTAEDVTIVGIACPGEEAMAGMNYGIIGYTQALTDHIISKIQNSDVVKAQLASKGTDILTGMPFADPDAVPTIYTMDQIMQLIPTLSAEKQAQLTAGIAQMRQSGMPDEQIAATISKSLAAEASSLAENLIAFGYSDKDKPTGINLYPVDFEAKDKIAQIIADYNKTKAEEDQITYTDYIGLMMSSITTIINAISYILIAFVAISLVVSSIMIGIITNISVLERTKEIGILRAVGASKKDVSHVFNAETVIEGLAAGLVGIGLTQILIIPINYLIEHVAGITARAYLAPTAAIILIAISILLTAFAGLIPASSAAKKDPVVALRSE